MSVISAFLDWSVHSAWGGVLDIVVGALLVLSVWNNPSVKGKRFRADLRGWVGGIGLIVCGLAIVVCNIIGVL